LLVRQLVEGEIERMNKLTDLPEKLLIKFAGVAERTWRAWKLRRGVENKHSKNVPNVHQLTPEETQAIIEYCSENTLKGYRPLCYEMIDRNIACVSAGSVYNVLKAAKLTHKWAEPAELKKKGFEQPTAVHEQWHIDFSYIRVCGIFYYFVGILDGYSRKILNWRLCETMEGINAEVLVAETKELYPEAKEPRVISDNGGQFTSKDFKELLLLLELEHTCTSANHPQSNGKLERFNRTLKTEHVRRTAYVDYKDAKLRMGLWIAYYNSERLHSALNYLTPYDVFNGIGDKRLAERKEKLYAAKSKRQEYWLSIIATPVTPNKPA